jgi:hypothetical protein
MSLNGIIHATAGHGGEDTGHALESQLNMNQPSAKQQESSGKQYDFVLCFPQNDYHGAADKDVMTVGTENMAANPQPHPSQPYGIPGRRGHLVPGSNQPWRVDNRIVFEEGENRGE